jgi:hypothetical protein
MFITVFTRVRHWSLFWGIWFQSTQLPIQRVPGALFLGVKRLGREADHSPPSSAEVEECVEVYLHSPNTPSWCGVQLKKHSDNFTFPLHHSNSHSNMILPSMPSRAAIAQSVLALGYGLDDRGSKVRFPEGVGNFSLHHRLQNGSAADPASYPMGTRGSFLGVKRLGREADHWPPSSAEVKEWVELYLHSANTPSWRGAKLRKKHRDKFTFYHLCLVLLSGLFPSGFPTKTLCFSSIIRVNVYVYIYGIYIFLNLHTSKLFNI